jgi:hypothetical protein
MKEFNIESEDPAVHWPGMNITGKNILDLGCGRWGETDQSKMTPIYFLNQGAKSVVGVDACINEINYFNSLNLPNTTFIFKGIEDAPTVISLIQKYKIDTIKCDIEGRETFILDLKKEDITNISTLYIEYHGDHIKHALVPKLIELGFTIPQIGYLWFPGYGVLFCEK